MSTRGNAARRSVRPLDQPVRPAIALVVVALVLAALMGIEYLGSRLAAESVQEQVLGGDPGAAIAVVALVALAFLLAIMGLGLAVVVLSVLVVVKGGGKLRLGAALMLVASLLGLVVSFTISGDPSQFSDTSVAIANAFSVLEVVLDVLRVLVMIVGVVILVLGIREVRRQRAALQRG